MRGLPTDNLIFLLQRVQELKDSLTLPLSGAERAEAERRLREAIQVLDCYEMALTVRNNPRLTARPN